MNFEKLHQEEQKNNEALKPRLAARTVLFDKDGKVAILHVKKHGYYKIPGGGIEEEENVRDAAAREVAEETGCSSIIIGELGKIETEIPVWGMLDISEGFVAMVQGEKSQPNYEEWELERGFEVEWFNDLDTAIATIESNIVSEPGMETMQERDLNFLKLARESIK